MLRLRAGGYGVVRCDDALAHRFDAAQSRNPASAASACQTLVAPESAALARGFDPARRVPFVRLTAGPSSTAVSHAIVVPVAGGAELERAVLFIASAARAFGADAPVRLHVVLDGDVSPADVVTRIRPVLSANGTAMDDTVAVRVERVADLAAWRAGLDPGARVLVAAGHERDALSGLIAIPAAALCDLLEPALR